MQPRKEGLGEIPFCRQAVINQPPLELLPPGVSELLNYQAGEGNSITQKPIFQFSLLLPSSPL